MRTQGHTLTIGNRPIGPDQPCFVIAEAGVNHDGSLEKAIALVDAAVSSEANAVKFQTFRTDKLVSAEAPLAQYQARQVITVSTQAELISSLELEYDEFRRLFDYCAARQVMFLSTPFDEASADFLLDLGVQAIKIGSGDLTNSLLLRHVAKMGVPVILSTGMGTLSEVEAALEILAGGASESATALLHCLSSYPAPVDQVNLRAMDTLRTAFQVPVGFSDHTLGIEIPLAAVAMGACVLEKHLTLDKTAAGPDHAASLEPMDFALMIQGIRSIESALGDGVKRCQESEMDTRRVARRSLVVTRDMPAGSTVSADALGLRRPGTGLPPTMIELVVGRKLRREMSAGQLLTLDILE